MYFSSIFILIALSLLYSPSTIQAYNTAQNPSLLNQTSAIAIIRNIISLKNLITANREYSVLPQIVTQDAILQITGSRNAKYNVTISSLGNITSYIEDTQGINDVVRESSSQFVELLSDFEARALSYTRETYFGQGNLTGQIVEYFERQEDSLRVENGVWKIFRTVLMVVGGPIGNPAVFIS